MPEPPLVGWCLLVCLERIAYNTWGHETLTFEEYRDQVIYKKEDVRACRESETAADGRG